MTENILYLGPNKWGGFDIISNEPDESIGEGTCKFHVTDELISEGKGMKMIIDSTYVKIDVSILHHVLNIFNRAGERICELGYKYGEPLNSDIKAGDYLFCIGDYIYIKDLSELTKKCWEESFYYDGINLQLNLNAEGLPISWEEFLSDHDLENDMSDLLLIPQDTYSKALNIAKSTIIECKDFLQNLYEEKRKENKQASVCLSKRFETHEEFLTKLGYFDKRANNGYFIVCDFTIEPYELLSEAEIFEERGLKGCKKDCEVLCPPIFDQIISFPKKGEIYLIKGNMYTLFTSSGYNLMNGDINEELKKILKNGE